LAPFADAVLDTPRAKYIRIDVGAIS